MSAPVAMPVCPAHGPSCNKYEWACNDWGTTPSKVTCLEVANATDMRCEVPARVEYGIRVNGRLVTFPVEGRMFLWSDTPPSIQGRRNAVVVARVVSDEWEVVR